MLLGFRELNLHANATNIEFELNFNARKNTYTHSHTHIYISIYSWIRVFIINKFVNKIEMQCGLLLPLAITSPTFVSRPPVLPPSCCLRFLHTFCAQYAGPLLSLIHFVPSIMNLSAFCKFHLWIIIVVGLCCLACYKFLLPDTDTRRQQSFLCGCYCVCVSA